MSYQGFKYGDENSMNVYVVIRNIKENINCYQNEISITYGVFSSLEKAKFWIEHTVNNEFKNEFEIKEYPLNKTIYPLQEMKK